MAVSVLFAQQPGICSATQQQQGFVSVVCIIVHWYQIRAGATLEANTSTKTISERKFPCMLSDSVAVQTKPGGTRLICCH
ncbi:MAG TPA: hypothetical protein VGB22_10850 [candidate division Zixibacteria bacterium]